MQHHLSMPLAGRGYQNQKENHKNKDQHTLKFQQSAFSSVFPLCANLQGGADDNVVSSVLVLHGINHWEYSVSSKVFSPEILQMFRSIFCPPAGLTTFYHWSELSSVNSCRELQLLAVLLKSLSSLPHSSSRNCILNWTASKDAAPL